MSRSLQVKYCQARAFLLHQASRVSSSTLAVRSWIRKQPANNPIPTPTTGSPLGVYGLGLLDTNIALPQPNGSAAYYGLCRKSAVCLRISASAILVLG